MLNQPDRSISRTLTTRMRSSKGDLVKVVVPKHAPFLYRKGTTALLLCYWRVTFAGTAGEIGLRITYDPKEYRKQNRKDGKRDGHGRRTTCCPVPSFQNTFSSSLTRTSLARIMIYARKPNESELAEIDYNSKEKCRSPFNSHSG